MGCLVAIEEPGTKNELQPRTTRSNVQVFAYFYMLRR